MSSSVSGVEVVMAGEISAVSRRRLLELLAAGVSLAACDRITVEVVPKDGISDGNGILPITPNNRFYVYQYGVAPTYEVDDWTCPILTLGEERFVMDAAFFDTLTPMQLEHTLQCIGGNPRNALIGNAVWGGLPFLDVLDALGIEIDPAVVEVRFDGADEYSTAIPVSDLLDSKLWLVWQMNGEPLPFDHGAPCRFLVQGRYGTKNVKWPISVALIDTPYVGYWEQGGWSNDATYRQNGFVFEPVDGTVVPGPTVNIVGTAYAGEDPVARVEISFDDGESWEDTELYYAPGPNIWTLWRYVLEGAAGTTVRAQVRVTTEGGLVTIGPEVLDQSGGYDGGMRISFEVEE